jgi:GH25 family lysozyme M1 (1,4-beta-N-acetylmuramidase)
MLNMQDISNWQGPKAPEAVAKNEVLAIKASEGAGFQDPDFENNWAYAKTNEKARIAYHYFHPSVPPLVQASYFLSYVDRFGVESGDMFALDLEVTDGIPPADVAKAALAFVQEVNHQTRASTWVYTNLFMAQSGNCAGLGDSPLWIADPSSPPGKPVIPEPWKLWTAHQYGVVKGIDVDLVNVETVNQLAKLGALIGDPEPDPTNVVVTLTDGAGHEKREDFNQTTMLAQLRGKSLEIGTAKVSFA